MEPPTEAELDQLEIVALGLGFLVWRYLFFVLGLAFATAAAVLLLLETFRSAPPTSTLPQVLFGIFLLLAVTMFFTAVVLGFVGAGMCAKAPPRVGSGGIFTAILLDSLFVVLALTSVALAMIASINTPPIGRFGPPPADKTLTTIRWIVLIVLFVVMLLSQLLCHLFLKNLRNFLQERAGVVLNMILWLSALGGGALVVGLEVLIMNLAEAFPPTIARVALFTLTPFLLFALVVNPAAGVPHPTLATTGEQRARGALIAGRIPSQSLGKSGRYTYFMRFWPLLGTDLIGRKRPSAVLKLGRMA